MITDAKKLEIIGYLLDVHNAAVSDDDGDRHLADQGYLIEAIDSVMAGHTDAPWVRMFTDGTTEAGK